jgi:uncharacterized membrane protein YidH (DUF202 family)
MTSATQEPPAKPTDSPSLALQRTHMAVERTFFSVLRTGLAIAGAGTVIVTILGTQWPWWLSTLLAGIFIVVGYIMIIAGLRRYQKVASRLRIEHKLEVISPKLITFLTITLQVAVAVVLILFLIGLLQVPGPLFEGL